jgi:hypothetical protein
MGGIQSTQAFILLRPEPCPSTTPNSSWPVACRMAPPRATERTRVPGPARADSRATFRCLIAVHCAPSVFPRRACVDSNMPSTMLQSLHFSKPARSATRLWLGLPCILGAGARPPKDWSRCRPNSPQCIVVSGACLSICIKSLDYHQTTLSRIRQQHCQRILCVLHSWSFIMYSNVPPIPTPMLICTSQAALVSSCNTCLGGGLNTTTEQAAGDGRAYGPAVCSTRHQLGLLHTPCAAPPSRT